MTYVYTYMYLAAITKIWTLGSCYLVETQLCSIGNLIGSCAHYFLFADRTCSRMLCSSKGQCFFILGIKVHIVGFGLQSLRV